MTLNPINYYHELIDGLNDKGLEIHPLSELKPSSKPAIGLRHDIDNHPHIALHMARYLAMKGLPGSFYLLHSASYYTRENIPQIVYKMNVAGCEIGLHNDAWAYYEKGPRVVKNELEYLRNLGAQIKGTVAHNSLSTYKAENYEVFKEKVLLNRDNGLPLGKLSMKKLDLTYEGTFAVPKRRVNLTDFSNCLKEKPDIQSKEWMYNFLVDSPYCDYETYAQFWLIGLDEWAVAIRGKLHWKIGLSKVLDLTETIPPTTKSIFVIHPDYFDPCSTKENIEISIPPRRQRYASLPRPIKIVGRRIRGAYHTAVFWLSQKRRHLAPVSERWARSQENYVKWSNEPLPEEYLQEIIELGRRFAEYVGDPKKCLDVGCGNGLFAGKTYADVGYSYLTKNPESWIVGLDPLPLLASVPWLDEYRRGTGENMPFPDREFDKVVIATSLDHVENPHKCISECHRVLKPEGVLYIWTTYKGYIDDHHPHGIQSQKLNHILRENGFKAMDEMKVAENDQYFLKAVIK